MAADSKLAHAFAGQPSLAYALTFAHRDLAAEAAAFLEECPDGATCEQVARGILARTRDVREILNLDDRFTGPQFGPGLPVGRKVYRLAPDGLDGQGRPETARQDGGLDRLAFIAGQAELIASLLAPLTEAARQAEDVAGLAYLDGRFEETDAPPGVAAGVYRNQVYAIFKPLIDTLERHGLTLLDEMNDPDPHHTMEA